jgi:predicted transcriptional regulator
MDRSGGVSQGALLTVMLEAAAALLRQHGFPDIVLEGISTYFLQPVSPERELEVCARLIDIGRHTGKVDISIVCEGSIVCKTMASVQSLKD